MVLLEGCFIGSFTRAPRRKDGQQAEGTWIWQVVHRGRDLVVELTSYCWISLAGNEGEFLFEQPWGVFVSDCHFFFQLQGINLAWSS